VHQEFVKQADQRRQSGAPLGPSRNRYLARGVHMPGTMSADRVVGRVRPTARFVEVRVFAFEGLLPW
jgi:hypothetical protein